MSPMSTSPLLPALLLGAIAQPAPAQEAGADAFAADRWFHWIGDGPSARALEGRAVLLHFFVCEKPKKAAFLPLIQFHHDYRGKGLVILAVTPDSPGRVEELLRDHALPFPVAAGAGAMKRAWGVGGDYAQILLDPDGELFFRADAANGIWNGKLRKGVQGAERLKERACLRLAPAGECSRELRKPVEELAAGDLREALESLERTLESDSTSDGVRAEAEALRAAVEGHVEALLGQIRAAFERREAALAWSALETLAEELDGHPLGTAPAERLEERRRDPAVQLELEASAEYDELVEAFFARGWEKNLARFEKLVADYPETRSAEKMHNYWIQRRW